VYPERAARGRMCHPILRRILFVQVPIFDANISDISRGELGVEVCGGFIRLDDGLERRRELLFRERDPINGLEERVLLELLGVSLPPETVLGIPIEKLPPRG
jgi:hypothetical protein